MINDKLGTNYTDEDIQNYFIGKTWEGLEKKYRQHLKDAEDEAKYWEEVGKEQLLNEKKARIEDEAISFLENPREVTMEYAEDNPEVVQKLWQMLLPSENYGQKLEEDGIECVEIKQHSSVLHPATKLLKEKILSQEAFNEDNPLLEINFANARCTEDTNLNKYVNKKRSNGKVDMVVSTINAVHLVQQEILFGDGDFLIQMI